MITPFHQSAALYSQAYAAFSEHSVLYVCQYFLFKATDVLTDDSGENEEEQACGTTATVMLVRKDKVVVANIGDSRAVLSRHGQAVNLSTEHR